MELDSPAAFTVFDSDELRTFLAALSSVTAVQIPFATVAHAAVVAAGCEVNTLLAVKCVCPDEPRLSKCSRDSPDKGESGKILNPSSP